MLDSKLREAFLDRVSKSKVGGFKDLKLFTIMFAKELVDDSQTDYLTYDIDGKLRKELLNGR